jgi:hypothetical protein
MMAGGIDLLHFATVHQLDVQFELDIDESRQHTALWKLDGKVPATGWRGKIANWLIGGRLNYHAKVAGGSVVTLTYGPDLRFRLGNLKVPTLHILWGGVADQEGISDVDIFLLAPRGKGFLGKCVAWMKIAFTILLQVVLKDDDAKAFPHMRFNFGRLMKEDASVSRMAKFLDNLPLSPWSRPGADRDG